MEQHAEESGEGAKNATANTNSENSAKSGGGETTVKDEKEEEDKNEAGASETPKPTNPPGPKLGMMPPMHMPPGYPPYSPDPQMQMHPHPHSHHPHMPPPYGAYPYPPHFPPPHPHFWGPPPPRPTAAPTTRPPDRYQSEVDGREGATSPSQIQTSHKEEVQHMGCTCKKTRCLKLYCQCFGVKLYCGTNCRCLQCYNVEQHEKFRKEAMRLILSRNPSAFDTKFKKNQKDEKAEAKSLAHKLGCKCRKSACMKKVCRMGLQQFLLTTQNINFYSPIVSFSSSIANATQPTLSAVEIVVVWGARIWETVTTSRVGRT